MRIYAPKYYKDFKCIAGLCKKSCCVGWEIRIDKATLQKYESMSEGYGASIRKSIDYDEEPHFCLSDGRCPHLDGQGLCRIITEYSEEYLSDICRLHPRFFSYTHRGCEVGLGMSCPEAARIILTSESYSEIVEIGRDRRKTVGKFDTSPYIDEIYAILSDKAHTFRHKANEICDRFSLSEYERDAHSMQEVLSGLEYKDENNKEKFALYTPAFEKEDIYGAYLERALAYFVYRHVSECESREEISPYLAFCIFLTELLAYLLYSDSELLEMRKNTNKEKEEERIFLLASILSDEIEYSTDNTEILLSEFLF